MSDETMAADEPSPVLCTSFRATPSGANGIGSLSCESVESVMSVPVLGEETSVPRATASRSHWIRRW